jgi:hypothetical protein
VNAMNKRVIVGLVVTILMAAGAGMLFRALR